MPIWQKWRARRYVDTRMTCEAGVSRRKKAMAAQRSFSELVITSDLNRLFKAALKEDAGTGDITSELIVPPGMKGHGRLIAKEQGVFCGAQVAERIWKIADGRIEIRWNAREGSDVKPGEVLAALKGRL